MVLRSMERARQGDPRGRGLSRLRNRRRRLRRARPGDGAGRNAVPFVFVSRTARKGIHWGISFKRCDVINFESIVSFASQDIFCSGILIGNNIIFALDNVG